MNKLLISFCFIAISLPFSVRAVSVIDDAGNTINLKSEVQRIVTLAPHIVEQLFAIGAGDRIVGTVSYSDYPEAAKQIPLIGGYTRFDLETIVALKPELVIGWLSGNNPEQITQLKNLGIEVLLDEPQHVDDIAHSIERLGVITGKQHKAAEVADKFREGFKHLREQYQSKSKVTLFYQLWHKPLMTVNGRQIINDVLDICGGDNIFKELPTLTPVVSREAVIAADPKIIIISGMKDVRPKSYDEWLAWDSMRAVKGEHLYTVKPDLIHRATPRILWGAEKICAFIDSARQN